MGEKVRVQMRTRTRQQAGPGGESKGEPRAEVAVEVAVEPEEAASGQGVSSQGSPGEAGRHWSRF